MADDLHSGTVAGLLQFLEYAGEKGLLHPTTAGARRSACIKVLEIDGAGWRDQKVADIDPESQFDRFSRKSGSKYSPGSLATYGQRFRDAMSQYEDFLANPTGFKGQPPRQVAKRKATPGAKPSKKVAGAGAPTAPPRSEELITYPFPLETGVLGYVQLPREISGDDVERLCDFVRSLALRPRRPGSPKTDET